jgi:hypothetical protein
MAIGGCNSCSPAAGAYAQGSPVRPVQRVGPRATAEASEFRRSSAQSAGITVTTAEGDKVTLSFSSQRQDAVSSYRARGAGGGGYGGGHGGQRVPSGQGTQGDSVRIQGRESRSQSATEVSVSIEGDLNETELADIKKLIEGFGAVAQGQAEVGDLARQFGSLESLATAKLNYSSVSETSASRVRLYA